jgi:ATP-dependent protease HslVU (ClpYQ) peptidase subunit
MTTIAAIQGKNWVVMGADSQSTHDEYRRVKMSDDKVINNNGILIAGCGSGRGMNLLQYVFKAPKPQSNLTPDKLDKWVSNIFIPEMRQTFMDHGYDMKDDGDYAQHDGVFLVAVQGMLYIIDDTYAWDRDSRCYITSGSGGDFAQGSLYKSSLGGKLFTNLAEAKKEMKIAIDAAKEFDVWSGGETRIYVQQSE